MLVHHARRIPFAEGAPTQCASPTDHTDQVECPCRMRLARGISGHRGFSNGNRQTTDFGHYVKREQEVEDKGPHSGLSSNRSFPGFVTYLDVIGVKLVEDLKIFFEASADVSPNDGRV